MTITSFDTFQWNQPGIYLLKHKHVRKVLVVHSNNCLLSLARQLDALKKGYESNSSLTVDYLQGNLVALFYCKAPENLRERIIHHGTVCTDLQRLNYKFYRKRFSIYKAKIVFIAMAHSTYSAVKLVTKNRQGFIVGVFDKVIEAKNFIKTFYTPEVVNLTYAKNDLTKEYLENQDV